MIKSRIQFVYVCLRLFHFECIIVHFLHFVFMRRKNKLFLLRILLGLLILNLSFVPNFEVECFFLIIASGLLHVLMV